MKNLSSRLGLALALGLTLLTGACGHNRVVRVKRFDTQAVAGTKTPATLALVLNPAFTNYTLSYHLQGETFKLQMGPALRQYAADAAQAVGQQVTVCASRNQAMGRADAILIPRVARINATKCAGFAKRHVLICVEWSLLDRDAGKLLWLDTIAGQGAYDYGMSKGRERKMLQLGFDDLSQKTLQSLRESPALTSLGTKP